MSSTDRWWRLSRLWSALDNINDLATVEAEWKSWLGDEFTIIRPFLLSDGRRVHSYPRITAGDGGAPYEVIDDSAGGFLAVCPQGGATLHLSEPDVLAYRLDIRHVARRLCSALGLELDRHLPQFGPGVCRRIGVHRPTTATRCPVYLCMRQDVEEQLDSIRRLLSMTRDPFILLTPRHLDDADVEYVLRARSVCHLPLCDNIGFNGRAEMCATAPADRLLDEFRLMVEIFERGDHQRERFVFRRLGEAWMLVFEGEAIGLKHREGLQYIYLALSHAQKPLHVSEIAAICAGEEDVSPTGSAGEVLDAKAMKAYRARFESLESELTEAVKHHDEGRQEKLQEELDALAGQLAEAKGLGNRVRKASDDADRLRKSVTMAINRAIGAIETWDAAMASYLRNAIKTGQFIEYAPDRPVVWGL